MLQLDTLMAAAPKELVNCQSIEVVGEGGTIQGSADLNLHPVEVKRFIKRTGDKTYFFVHVIYV